MTMPVALPVTLPAVPDTPALVTPGTPDDAFAAVLAALSGVLGAPVPMTHPGPAPTADGHSGAGPAPVASSASTADLPPTASPVAWTATTQRAALPDVVPHVAPRPAAPASVETAQVVARGPRVATHDAAVRAMTPAAAQAPADEVAPAVQRSQAVVAPELDLPAVPAVAIAGPEASAAPVVDPTAPVQVAASQPVIADNRVDVPARAQATRHVQPAVLEAARGLRHEGGGRTSLVVRLDPPELGAVLVRLTVQDGRVDVQLRTPDLVARADLQAQSYDVQQVLREQGFDLSSFDVGHGDVFSSGEGDAPDRGTPQQARRADGRAGNPPVTDDAAAPEPSGTWL